MPRGYKKDGTKFGFKKGNKCGIGVKRFGKVNGMFGKHHSEKTKIKIGLKSLGRNNEENSPLWKGDKVGYVALHDWVRIKLGRPTTCEHCGKSGLTGVNIQWANKSGKYKRELSDWLRLCVSCHRKHDINLKKEEAK